MRLVSEARLLASLKSLVLCFSFSIILEIHKCKHIQMNKLLAVTCGKDKNMQPTLKRFIWTQFNIKKMFCTWT